MQVFVRLRARWWSINLGKIQYFIEQKNLTTTDKINLDLLKKINVISKNSKKLKILGNGEIKQKINIEADYYSKSAKEKLEKLGGVIQVTKK